jgi:hypothetical protein
VDGDHRTVILLDLFLPEGKVGDERDIEVAFDQDVNLPEGFGINLSMRSW